MTENQAIDESEQATVLCGICGGELDSEPDSRPERERKPLWFHVDDARDADHDPELPDGTRAR